MKLNDKEIRDSKDFEARNQRAEYAAYTFLIILTLVALGFAGMMAYTVLEVLVR